jgi:hypothetical protein
MIAGDAADGARAVEARLRAVVRELAPENEFQAWATLLAIAERRIELMLSEGRGSIQDIQTARQAIETVMNGGLQ